MKRRIEYWKIIELKPWAKFDLVPRQVQEDGPFWEERVEAIKAAGFNYVIIETEERCVEANI